MVDLKPAYRWGVILEDFRMQILFTSPTFIDTLFSKVAMYLGCPCSTFLGLFDRKLANNFEILILSLLSPYHFILQ